MKIAIISFTEDGWKLAGRIAENLRCEGHLVTADVKCKELADSVRESLSEWTEVRFRNQDALIFVGAVGIAVRAIAPYVRLKTKDPAVLVVDEAGRYCIPLLSGHIGGANELAAEVSAGIQAEPVITTATDLHGIWAVDIFAKKNHLIIGNMQRAKEISAKLLAGGRIRLAFQGRDTIENTMDYLDSQNMEITHVGCREPGQERNVLPEGLAFWKPEDEADAEVNGYTKPEISKEPEISIGIYRNPTWKKTLYLIPKALTVGIGCRRGTSAKQIEEAVSEVLEQGGILPESICRVASIDLKAKEPGLQEYCRKRDIPLVTCSAEELQSTEGVFSTSAFVQQTVGVDNVCERSAVCASGGGNLIVRKKVREGVTVALAESEWRVYFE